MHRDEVRRSSLRVRLGVVALVFLLIVMTAIGLSALMLRSWTSTIDARVQVRTTADDVAELRLAFSDQETGMRGYQLDGDAVALEPYRDGRAIQRRIVSRLDAREIDIAGFDAQLAAALSAGRTWQEQVAEPVIADPASAPDETIARDRFDAVRNELALLHELVNAELAHLDDEADRAKRVVFTVLFASALIAIASTALAASMFRRWVTVPLAKISDSARRLADDDTTPMPRFDAPELQDVSDAVELLQASLRSARDDAVAALEGIEQSAVLAIQVRSELADEIGEMPDGWAAHTLLVPAEGVVAGDCFDIGLLDAGRLYVVLIDVTGHGASAALNALKAKSQLRAALRSRRGPGPALDWLSSEMLKDGNADLLTAFVGVIELDTGRVRYANAGHPPALMTDGDHVIALDQGGPLIGAFDATWSTAEAVLEPGWTLLVHSDGVTDAVGDDRERFGDERLRSTIDTADPIALLDRVQLEVDRFRRGPRADDITVIAMHRAAPIVVDAGAALADHAIVAAEPGRSATPMQEDTLPT